VTIAFVLDDTLDRTDGVQQYILVLGKWLAESGNTVHYLVSHTVRQDVPNIHSLSNFVSANFNGNKVRTPLPANKRHIQQLMTQIKPDVLHVQLPCSPFLAGRVIAATPKTTAIVGTFHILPANGWHNYANKLLGIVLKRSLRRLSNVIAVSEPAAQFAKSTYGISTIVIPPAIDISAVRAGLLTRESGDLIKIAFLGRLVKRKGTLQLIRAFNALSPDVASRALLEIGGSGPLMKQAVKLAGQNKRIKFSGFIDETLKPAFLRASDIAVFPSTTGESFGIILVEAMGAGAGAVIGGNNPGYTSVLGGIPGSLVDPNDVSTFSAELARFITDAGARSSVYKQQQRAVQRYDISAVGPAVEDLYKRAIQNAKH
jgi:phosphatidylinositol alpha-mannosyltransferase